jgi:hypothetical protein
MTDEGFFELLDPLQEWYRDLFENHKKEAAAMVASILAKTTTDERGCRVTATKQPRKVRFRGQQDRAYRFVYSVVNEYAAARHEVVRHRCNNRVCVNPDHLTIGNRADNLRDHRGFRANGVDWDHL